jgi:hypothetical protein
VYSNFKLNLPIEAWEAYRTVDEDGYVIAWQHRPRTNCVENAYSHTIPGKTRCLGRIDNYQGEKQLLKI